jgi:RNA polymerase sigma-70 factor (ECF subfamily)
MSGSDLYAQGRAAWPKLDVSQPAFDAALAERGDITHGDELYLAIACAAGETAAIQAFEARYFTCIAPVTRRLALGDDDAREVEQTLRQRLFVAHDGAPKILAYAGRGQLAGLVQIAATRVALNLVRGRRRIVDEPIAEVPTAANDTIYAKAEYREHVRQAIEGAAAALDARDRTVLRMHLVDRASIDDIATVYRVHRATAARWVTAAREALVATTRDRFLEAAQLAPDDSDGLASFVESQLTLSLDRILR